MLLLKCTHCVIHLSNAKYTWNAGVRLHYYLLHRQYLLGLLSFVAEDPLFHGWFVASSRPPHFHPQLNFLNYHWGLIFCDPVRNVKKLRIIALPCFRNVISCNSIIWQNQGHHTMYLPSQKRLLGLLLAVETYLG